MNIEYRILNIEQRNSECNELIALFVASISTAQKNKGVSQKGGV